MLKIYNAISKKKEYFKPIKNSEISIYVCGVTVYDLCHIGHARTFIIFDVIIRYLRYIGYNVRYIRNITDIDDKIIINAKKNNETIEKLTNRMIAEMHKDFDSLNILHPDIEPKVTDHINDIIKFISNLVDLGHAYVSKNGDVMFNIKSYNNYGFLSHQNLSKLNCSIDIKKNKSKNKLADFVLWKKAKINEPYWNSQWGNGRPGWHIECSAINYKYLGNHFDIHGGGIDLKFPHHENEIAQSISAHKSSYVNYWIHSGMVMVNSEKMSKSLGNFFTIREALTKYDPETLRYFLLSNHYSSPLYFSEDKIYKINISLKRLYIALLNTDINVNSNEGLEFENDFRIAMDDNFNIPKIYSIFFSMAHKINNFKKNNKFLANSLASKLRKLGNILGILQQDPEKFLKNNKNIDNNFIKEIEYLIKKRDNYRNSKNWKQADIIRNKLNELGVLLEDEKKETKWYYK